MTAGPSSSLPSSPSSPTSTDEDDRRFAAATARRASIIHAANVEKRRRTAVDSVVALADALAYRPAPVRPPLRRHLSGPSTKQLKSIGGQGGASSSLTKSGAASSAAGPSVELVVRTAIAECHRCAKAAVVAAIADGDVYAGRSPPLLVEMGSCGAVVYALNALMAHVRAPVLVRPALELLSSLLPYCPENRRRFLAVGGLRKVERVLRTHPLLFDVVEAAVTLRWDVMLPEFPDWLWCFPFFLSGFAFPTKAFGWYMWLATPNYYHIEGRRLRDEEVIGGGGAGGAEGDADSLGASTRVLGQAADGTLRRRPTLADSMRALAAGSYLDEDEEGRGGGGGGEDGDGGSAGGSGSAAVNESEIAAALERGRRGSFSSSQAVLAARRESSAFAAAARAGGGATGTGGRRGSSAPPLVAIVDEGDGGEDMEEGTSSSSPAPAPAGTASPGPRTDSLDPEIAAAAAAADRIWRYAEPDNGWRRGTVTALPRNLTEQLARVEEEEEEERRTGAGAGRGGGADDEPARGQQQDRAATTLGARRGSGLAVLSRRLSATTPSAAGGGGGRAPPPRSDLLASLPGASSSGRVADPALEAALAVLSAAANAPARPPRTSLPALAGRRGSSGSLGGAASSGRQLRVLPPASGGGPVRAPSAGLLAGVAHTRILSEAGFDDDEEEEGRSGSSPSWQVPGPPPPPAAARPLVAAGGLTASTLALLAAGRDAEAKGRRLSLAAAVDAGIPARAPRRRVVLGPPACGPDGRPLPKTAAELRREREEDEEEWERDEDGNPRKRAGPSATMRAYATYVSRLNRRSSLPGGGTGDGLGGGGTGGRPGAPKGHGIGTISRGAIGRRRGSTPGV
jgi:hypothetical protein